MNQANPSSLGTAVVTGASSGIGKVYAQRLAARGYDLLLVARRKDRLESIATELQSRFPVQVRVLAADLAHPEDLAAVSEKISADDAVTMLVNNAGTSSVAPVAQVCVETIGTYRPSLILLPIHVIKAGGHQKRAHTSQ